VVHGRVLITGITGFAGSHLAEKLVADGAEVHGFAFEAPPFPNLASVATDVQVHRGDITSLDDVRAATRAARPDVVVHLAGQAVPTLAARDPVAAVRVNVLGTATVLAALAEQPGSALVLASSGEVYGTPERSLVTEDAAIAPTNPYAATKVAAEALARELGDREGRSVVILRPTNQIGPRQHEALAASAFAKQVAEAEIGRAAPVVRHGSLDARRDFLDVRDMADAYARATEIREPGTKVFNVGTGRAVGIDEILNTLIGFARIPIRAELDPERVRAGVAPALALDASRFRARTGWEPRTPLETSLRDLLDYWRARVREGARV
jgi:GDP-4-dehydro-6-deoxy-D-mannose reductase